MKKGLLVAAAVALLVVGVWYLRPQPDQPAENGDDGAGPVVAGETLEPAVKLDLMQRALAETENLNTDEAVALWNQLLAKEPGNLDALQNLAVTHVSRMRQLSEKLNAPQTTPEERADAEQQIPLRIADASEVTERLIAASRASEATLRQDAALWLDAKIDITAAELASFDERQAAMAGIVQDLVQQLQASPGAAVLVGLLEDAAAMAEDPLGGGADPLVDPIAEALIAASVANPRNLFIAFKALEFSLKAEKPEAAEIAARLGKLTEPLDTFVRPAALAGAGVPPETFPANIAEAVNNGNYRAAMLPRFQWHNLLKGTEIFKSDRKLAAPNPLDLVATDAINQLALQLAAESLPSAAASELSFSQPATVTTTDSPVLAVAKVDLLLNDRAAILVATSDRLSVWQAAEAGWTEWASLAIPAGTRGLTVVELFMVDADFPLKIKRSYQADSEANPAAAGENSLRHDVFPSILAWGQNGLHIVRVDGRQETPPDQRLLPLNEPTGLESIADVVALQPIDIDADGDLDLAISTLDDGVQFWINRDNMTFFSATEFSQLPPQDDPVVDFGLVDLDRDLDLDLLTIHRSGAIGWLENLLHLQFRWAPLEAATPVGPGGSIAAVEWDGNVSWDAIYSGSQGVGLMLTETTGAGVFRPNAGITRQAATENDTLVGGRAQLADLDHDSWSDLLLYGPRGAGLLRGGPSELPDLPIMPLFSAPVAAATIADFNGDDRLDVCLASGNEVLVLANTSDSLGHFVEIQMKGINDNATGRVNHYAIGSTHEVRFGPHYRAAVVTDRTTRFGINRYESADTLRSILTNGITQNIIDPPSDVTIVEEQTLKGSCPYLYTWDGEKFAFVTDCLWAAPLGLQYAVGKVVPDRPWEYLKVDGDFLQPRDGHYEVRLTEELWEIAYFDHVALMAVDHPAEVDIWTNEKVGPPDVVQHRVYAFADSRPVVSAVDTNGVDCQELLATIDENYVQGFERRIRQGLCPPHWIDLGIGPLAADDEVYLLLTGWILPTDSSLNIQIDQNPQLPAVEPPSVWIPDAEGNWVESIPAMGFPGGKTKTIVVKLTGKFNPLDTRVRIRTSAQIYWDAAKVVVNPPQTELRTQTLELVSAEVGEHGFSRLLPRDSTQPHRYDYHQASKQPKWPPLAGGLTRFGDCLELLTEWDDQMVVIAGGDEIRLKFAVPAEPLPAGWKRDFVLHSVGWDKDADLNTLAGQSVDPLPFRAMRAYPPPFEDQAAAKQADAANAWHRTRTQSFRKFWAR